MRIMDTLVSYMEMVEHRGWSVVAQNAGNTNTSYPVVEGWVCSAKGAMTHAAKESITLPRQDMTGTANLIFKRNLKLFRGPYCCKLLSCWQFFDHLD